jgi:hypothetical protein
MEALKKEIDDLTIVRDNAAAKEKYTRDSLPNWEKSILDARAEDYKYSFRRSMQKVHEAEEGYRQLQRDLHDQEVDTKRHETKLAEMKIQLEKMQKAEEEKMPKAEEKTQKAEEDDKKNHLTIDMTAILLKPDARFYFQRAAAAGGPGSDLLDYLKKAHADVCSDIKRIFALTGDRSIVMRHSLPGLAAQRSESLLHTREELDALFNYIEEAMGKRG